MSKIALGPVVLGGNVFGWTVRREDAFALLDAYVEKGGVSIDTADVYPAWVPGNQGGESEGIIGDWMEARKNRERLVITSKVGAWTAQPGLSAANIRAAVEGSLRRLKTDYLDIYYAHRDDEKTAPSEFMAAFGALVKEGKVRALGASNFSAERLVASQAFSRQNGLAGFTYSQDSWNLVDRGIEKTLVPTLLAEGITELPYYSLASGFLTGKYRPGTTVESARAGGAERPLKNPKNVALLALMDELAADRGVSVAAVALGWLRAQNPVGAPIASARTIEQLGPLFEDARLTAEDVARLSAITE